MSHKLKENILVLDQVEKTKQFELLDSLVEKEHWSHFATSDRHRFAKLLLLRAEILLRKDLSEALKMFDVAAKVDPNSQDILFQQATCHVQNCDKGGDLSTAIRSLRSILTHNCEFLEAWVLLAETYLLLAQQQEDFEHLTQTIAVFQQAHQAFDTLKRPIPPRLYWQWGRSLVAIGVFSQEPNDYYEAIQKFDQAISYGLELGELCFDYGNALIDLATFIGKKEHLVEAIGWYKKAEALSVPKRIDYSYRLAIAYKAHFVVFGDQESYEKALLYFEVAENDFPQDSLLFEKWGELLYERGKRDGELGLVRESFRFFEKAAEYHEHPEEVFVIWSEALLTVGSQEEMVEYLKLAYDKLTFAAMLVPQETKVWYLLGTALNELGLYFQDAQYFSQAIDKFRQGLIIEQENAKLWWGLGNSCYFLGELSQDVSLVEQSLRYYAQVVEFCPEGYPSFWNDWGVVFMKVGEWRQEKEYVEAAIDRFDHAIKMQVASHPGRALEPEWVFNLACALDFLGDLTLDPLYYEQSIQIFSKVLTVDPDFPMLKYNLALALTHLGEHSCDVECFSKALDLFEQLGQKDPEDDFLFNDWAVAIIHYAQMTEDPTHPQWSESYFDDAEAKLHHAISLGNHFAYYNIACLHAIRGQHDECLEYLEKSFGSGTLPPIPDLLEDEWLESVRGTQGFENFIEEVKVFQRPCDIS